jgi:hypothetical protein
MMLADDFETADELNAYLDSLVQGGALQRASLAPAVVESASHFHRLGAIAKPEQRFVLGLEKKLMDSTLSAATPRVATVSPTMPNPNGNLRLPNEVVAQSVKSKRLKPILLAAVTVICIASATAFGVYRLMPPSPPESNEIPAPVVAMQSNPDSDALSSKGCTVQPRTEEQHALQGPANVKAILEATEFATAPNQREVMVPAMAATVLPTGEPTSAEVLAGIESTLQELVSCLNAGDFARVDALYSDDSFRRAYGHRSDISPATTTAVPSEDPVPVPSILESHILPDSRIGVLLAHDVNGFGLQEYLIFVKQADLWLVDEQVFVAPDASGSPSPVATPGAAQVVIQATDFAFEPDRVTVPANVPVGIRLRNLGRAPHTFVIEELGIEVYLEPGHSTTIEITVPDGEFEFVSDIPGQSAAGMSGTLIGEASATPEVGQTS